MSIRSFAACLRRLRRDERGMSLVEMGLMAPFLGTLLMLSIDLGKGFSERYGLQQVAHRTIELANSRALEVTSDADAIDFSFLEQEAADAAGVPLSDVDLTRWTECEDGSGVMRLARPANASDDPFSIDCGDGRRFARYVQLEIRTSYKPVFPLARIYPNQRADGTVPMSVEAAVRIQ